MIGLEKRVKQFRFWENSGNIPEISRKLSGNFQDISRTFPEIPRNFSGNFPDFFRKNPGNSPEIFRKKKGWRFRTSLVWIVIVWLYIQEPRKKALKLK